ncbi:GNAT family N-acetyltransferase [Rathayibacter sp. VKM Ac-2760]|uniref:GNAT family N-acetyltransferase n=1 Tax=Rathayibacter sp. VKM Ac-2760 TaxID=2609253 RepID=UPI001ABDB864|nr:GNAT family N-acetyltransferase [Rathayibacter sp. VKM Ac-2760]
MATGADSPFIDTVESTAFGLQADRVVSLAHGLRLTSTAVVELVAEDAEHLVGHVMLSRGWLDAPAELVEVLVLSPLAVVPSQQHRGIGRRLIEQATLSSLAQLGNIVVVLVGVVLLVVFLLTERRAHHRSGTRRHETARTS